MPTTTPVGTLIREARERRGLGVRQLALKAHVQQPWLSQVETGHIQRPGTDRLTRIAHALEVDPVLLHAAAGHLDGAAPSPEEAETALRLLLYNDARLTSSQARALLTLYREFTGAQP